MDEKEEMGGGEKEEKRLRRVDGWMDGWMD